MLDAIFKKAYGTALRKLMSLWNLQSRSTVAADSTFEEIGRRFVVSCVTRWNSEFDSVKILIIILETKMPVFTRVMTKLKLPNFTDQNIILLKEYDNVNSLWISN